MMGSNGQTVALISDALPFGDLAWTRQLMLFGYAVHSGRSYDA